MAVNQEYKEYRVNDLPETGYAGDRYYLNVGGGKFQTYIISDSLTPVREAGQEFIECDTVVDDLRNLDARQIWAIQNGYYKGVRVSGYHDKGDTPAPIEYYLSETEEDDDGGSVFEVGGVKLEHEFKGNIHASYYGCKGDFVNAESYTDNTIQIQRMFNKIGKGKILFSKGAYAHSDLIIPSGDGGDNSIELVIESDGRLSSGGSLQQSSSGIVQLRYIGQEGSAAIKSDSLQSWLDFKNIILINSSGRTDVDGLVMQDYRSNEMSNFSIILFRDNLVINGDTYYTVFSKCSFTHAKRNNVYLNGLANMTTFRECRISLSESVGLRSPRIGDGINIVDSFIEGNKGAGIYINNCRLLNIKGTYIENNATVGNVLTGVRSQIIFGAYTNNLNTPSKIAIERSYIMASGDGCEFIYAMHTSSPTIGNINVSIVENTIPATLISLPISTENRTHLVRCNYPAYSEVYLDNNKYSYTDKTKMYYPVNSRPSVLASFYSNNDDCVTFLRPEWDKANFSKNTDQKGVVTNKITYVSPLVLGDGSNKDTTFDIDHDLPDLTTAGASIRHGRFTNTSGNIIERWYNPTVGSIEETAYLDWKLGKFKAKEYAIGLDGETRILTGLAVPEGNFFAKKGSIYLYGNTAETRKGIYIKTTDISLNTGWELITPMRQSASVANVASADATDLETALVLINELKAQLNAKLTADRASGQQAT